MEVCAELAEIVQLGNDLMGTWLVSYYHHGVPAHRIYPPRFPQFTPSFERTQILSRLHIDCCSLGYPCTVSKNLETSPYRRMADNEDSLPFYAALHAC